MFVARAKASVPGLRIADDELPIAARICRRLDGLPLALEMVAAWAGILGLPALEKKLEGSLQSWLRARSTAPQRQSNLAATLRWSYDLLSSAEQVVLARLSAFAGPFTIEAAEAVAGYGSIPGAQVFEHVASLVRKSMLALASGASPPEFRLLETTRAFAAEQLADSPDAQETRRRYASHVLRCLTAAAEEWERLSDALWRKRYAPLLPDLRAALDWAIAQDSRVAVALAGVGWPLWREMSLHTEGRQRLNAAIALITPDTPPVLAARSLRGLSELSLNTDAVSVAYDKLLEAVSLYRQESVSPELGATLLDVAYAAQALGRIDEARRYHSEAMALLEGTDRHRTIAHAHCVQATIEISAGDLQAAEAASSIAIRLSEAAGADRTALVVSANLLEARLVEEDFQAAVEGGIRLCERLRSSPYADVLGFALGLLTIAFVFTGEEEKALIAAREAAAILREENMMFWMYDYLALRLAKKERYTDAAVLLGYANHLFARSGWLREPTALRAVRMALELLRPAMGAAELEQLIASGGHLSEERAVALALNS
ncbi:MAG: hypothetical protein JO208_02790 [Alphaproteobacteria bacterium]|nr:hypothetical protein [Alphaproteobacteria bacterium]